MFGRAASSVRPLRQFSTSRPGPTTSGPLRRNYTRVALALGTGVVGTTYFASPVSLDKSSLSPGIISPPAPSIQDARFWELARSYLVYTLCSIPLLIDNSPKLLHTLTHSPIPGLKTITEEIVRGTFFAQFVAGESVAGCRESMEKLRSRGVGTMLNYSAEAEIGADFDASLLEQARLEEVERALDEAGQFERDVEARGGMAGSTAFALKIVCGICPL